MKTMNHFIIEPAALHEMDFLLTLAKAEAWNPGLSDALPFHSTDPNGFFIGKLDGKMIGCISAVAYNEDYGFMGLYIMLPEYRGLGYGLKLWQHAVNYLGKRNIGLDGVVAQQNNYRKSGFELYYNNIRFSGKGKGKFSEELQNINDIPFQTLIDFDTPIFGIDRTRFLQPWIKMPNAFGLAKSINGKLTGYGLIRQCQNGYKIGPLFAQNSLIAEEIFLSLMAKSDRAEIFLDVVQKNDEAVKLAQKYHFQKVFETARMYKGVPPKQQLSQIFGITTFELG